VSGAADVGNADVTTTTVGPGASSYLNAIYIRGASLTIGASSKVQIKPSGGGDTHLDTSTSKLTGSLTLAGGATPTANLDLTNNLLIVSGGGAPTTVRDLMKAQIIQARNVPVGGVGDGTWDGIGIGSSTAAAHFVSFGIEERAVGYAINSDLPLG